MALNDAPLYPEEHDSIEIDDDGTVPEPLRSVEDAQHARLRRALATALHEKAALARDARALRASVDYLTTQVATAQQARRRTYNHNRELRRTLVATLPAVCEASIAARFPQAKKQEKHWQAIYNEAVEWCCATDTNFVRGKCSRAVVDTLTANFSLGSGVPLRVLYGVLWRHACSVLRVSFPQSAKRQPADPDEWCDLDSAIEHASSGDELDSTLSTPSSDDDTYLALNGSNASNAMSWNVAHSTTPDLSTSTPPVFETITFFWDDASRRIATRHKDLSLLDRRMHVPGKNIYTQREVWRHADGTRYLLDYKITCKGNNFVPGSLRVTVEKPSPFATP